MATRKACIQTHKASLWKRICTILFLDKGQSKLNEGVDFWFSYKASSGSKSSEIHINTMNIKKTQSSPEQDKGIGLAIAWEN